MGVQHFSDLASMSRHQERQELLEALRVCAMPEAAFSQWLRQSLDPLQQLANPALDAESTSWIASARCFRSHDEKQRFDETRELARAVQLALSRRPHDRTG